VRFGGVSSADRNAPNQGVSSNFIFQIGQNAHFYGKLAQNNMAENGEAILSLPLFWSRDAIDDVAR
jgi:hypothetical protein